MLQAERIIQQQTELDALERAKLVEKQQCEAIEKDLQEVVQQGAGVCAELQQMQVYCTRGLGPMTLLTGCR